MYSYRHVVKAFCIHDILMRITWNMLCVCFFFLFVGFVMRHLNDTLSGMPSMAQNLNFFILLAGRVRGFFIIIIIIHLVEAYFVWLVFILMCVVNVQCSMNVGLKYIVFHFIYSHFWMQNYEKNKKTKQFSTEIGFL